MAHRPSAQMRRMLLDALGGAPPASPLQLTRECTSTLPVQQAAIVVATVGGPTLAAASGPGAAAVEDAQLTLGLGPAHDAMSNAGPVLVPDLAGEARSRWPLLAAAVQLGGALFAIPLTLGATRVGVLDLYRTDTGPLTGPELGASMDVAELVATLLLLSSDWHLASSGPGEDGGWWTPDAPTVDDRVVHQASGMVSVQLDRSVGDALVLLRARAFADGRPLHELARDVVARRVRLDDDQGGREGSSDVITP